MLYEMWLRHDKGNQLTNVARNSTAEPFSPDQVRSHATACCLCREPPLHQC